MSPNSQHNRRNQLLIQVQATLTKDQLLNALEEAAAQAAKNGLTPLDLQRLIVATASAADGVLQRAKRSHRPARLIKALDNAGILLSGAIETLGDAL